MARKENNIHYIYKTTCNITGKWYVGMHSTCNLEDGYMGSGKILRYSIRKHGKDNHTKEILEYLSTREELIYREIEIVTKELIGDGLCINLKEGGEGGWGEIQRKAFKDKLLNDKEFRETLSKKHSEDSKKTMLAGKTTPIKYDWTGKNHSNESKQKISEKMLNTGIGETNSQYGTCWITKEYFNKKIRKEYLKTYISNGWIKGRKI